MLKTCSEKKKKKIFNYSYLSTGESYNTLAARFCLGVSTVHYIIKDTCQAIWDELKDEFMPIPKMQDWRRIERESGVGGTF